MAIQDRQTLKSYFETFDKPTEAQFADLIDSMLVKDDEFYLDTIVPFLGNINQNPLNTSGNEANSGITLIQKPFAETRIDLFVNGERVNIGNGIKGYDAYFSRDNGNTALNFSSLEAGDTLYWNGNVSHIGDLEDDDRVTIAYHVKRPSLIQIRPNDAELVESTVINFTHRRIFNTPTNPATGNITDNLNQARWGITQKLYHQDNTIPTIPNNWVKLHGNYQPNELNIIMIEWAGQNRVEYKIYQEQ